MNKQFDDTYAHLGNSRNERRDRYQKLTSASRTRMPNSTGEIGRLID